MYTYGKSQDKRRKKKWCQLGLTYVVGSSPSEIPADGLSGYNLGVLIGG